ncbi:MAG: LytTR family DNA-binding domain-containing protein [Prevotellaceae bacterium]|jgi:DNA-binding LytR/AlgR family response regulator|nr:LytTR family DNA-binding domain-containing protein [Prevotellaceae bacterium]
MRVLIVEDETAAYENLCHILAGIDPGIVVAENTESVTQTVDWLQNHPSPDLILMDIQLSDGSAFEIFQHVQVETPIIFTTAYDSYAIEAFKQQSVDYLLKPIKGEELKRALVKLGKWTRTEVVQYLDRLAQLAPAVRYAERMLLPVREKLIPVNLRDVAYFYVTGKQGSVCLTDGTVYPYTRALEQTLQSLDPAHFFRANKQFIVARDSIREIVIWFDSRLLVTLAVEAPERIYISKNRAVEFKEWMA